MARSRDWRTRGTPARKTAIINPYAQQRKGAAAQQYLAVKATVSGLRRVQTPTTGGIDAGEQIRDASEPRHRPFRRDFRERQQHERALRQMRMRHAQTGVADYLVA